MTETPREVIGVDTDILLHAHIAAMPHHRVAKSYLNKLLERGAELALTPLTLERFVEYASDPNYFDPAIRPQEAQEIAKIYLNKSNVRILPIDEACTRRSWQWLEKQEVEKGSEKPDEKRELDSLALSDALIAATLVQHGVRRIVTLNPKRFQGFSEITPVVPQSAARPSGT